MTNSINAKNTNTNKAVEAEVNQFDELHTAPISPAEAAGVKVTEELKEVDTIAEASRKGIEVVLAGDGQIHWDEVAFASMITAVSIGARRTVTRAMAVQHNDEHEDKVNVEGWASIAAKAAVGTAITAGAVALAQKTVMAETNFIARPAISNLMGAGVNLIDALVGDKIGNAVVDLFDKNEVNVTELFDENGEVVGL